MATDNFKFIVGQSVKVLSKDRNLNTKVFRVTTRHTMTPVDHKGVEIAGAALETFYKVTGEGIHSLSFFEDQLEKA